MQTTPSVENVGEGQGLDANAIGQAVLPRHILSLQVGRLRCGTTATYGKPGVAT